MPSLDFWCMLATQWWNYESDCVPEITLSYSQNMAIYFPSAKSKLSISYFLEYCYIIIFVHCISRFYSKRHLVHGKNVYKKLSVLNLTTICIKSFTYNDTALSVSFLNEIVFLHLWLHLKIDSTLNDWLSKYS